MSDQFAAALRAWADKVNGNLDGLARQTCQETAQRAVGATPVDTGFLRGNWQPSIGEMKVVEPAPAAGGDIALVCAGIKAGDVFYMTNNTAYAKRLEYGFEGKDSLGREYHQAGRYFVRDTVAQWPSIVEQIARELGAQ
ncbi:conserved hypothetical protein [uncultured Pleomorphomonas sp.]|uniref:HK97 gp10 family phage protein n=1 Tax=uncultured Pleomorphomonas sp. TaxID=442121 RepID=A0A212L1R3_9HYPH|nr:HK97 gp10 family phage protein [uncultured Pleomorphomonas sp.]SCM71501.1 conserved hypothetical protein [uncultured Pleomorphomonas sp.]